MSIGSVGGCSPSQMQATQYSSNAATGASRAPPPAQGGGEFVGAIAGALGELDVGSAAGDKLGAFLDSLAARLEASGPTGNLINTTA